MTIRRMHRADESFIRIAGESMASEMYPEFIPDFGKEIDLLRRADYARVIGELGKPHSALIAISGNNVWATKRYAAVLLWYGQKGGGLSLLRDFKRWAQEQNLLVASVTDDHDLVDNAKKVLRLSGFEQRGGTFMYFPKGSMR